MPSFRRKGSVIDADTTPPAADAPPAPDENDERVDAATALTLAEEAEAEAAEAEAVAAAARARARALRLRRQAQEAEQRTTEPEPAPLADEPVPADPAPVADTTPDPEPAGAVEDAEDIEDAERVEADALEPAADDRAANEAVAPGRRRLHLRVPLPTWKGVALTLAVLCTAALLAASGYMIFEHRRAERDARLSAEYAAAGRQAVVTLMSLDFTKAKEDVQRIIDNSTGKFREDFQQQAETFAQVAQDSKVITEVTVNSAAVKSMNDDTANVLVSATSRITNTAGAKEDPRGWRLSVDLQRDGDQIKMSRVEFVP